MAATTAGTILGGLTGLAGLAGAALPIIGGLSGLIEPVVGGLTDTLATTLTTGLTTLAASIGGIIDALGVSLESILPLIEGFVSSIGGLIGTYISELSQADIAGLITSLFTDLSSSITQIVMSLLGPISALDPTSIGRLVNELYSLAQQVAGDVSTLLGHVWNYASQILPALDVAAVEQAVIQTLSMFLEIPQEILSEIMEVVNLYGRAFPLDNVLFLLTNVFLPAVLQLASDLSVIGNHVLNGVIAAILNADTLDLAALQNSLENIVNSVISLTGLINSLASVISQILSVFLPIV